MEWQRENFIISTDKSKLNIHYIHQFLSNESYWAAGIPYAIVEKSIPTLFVLVSMTLKNKSVLHVSLRMKLHLVTWLMYLLILPTAEEAWANG